MTMTTAEFIAKAKLKHGDRYDYSKTEYVNQITDVIIICKEHGEFLQRPNNHYMGAGCPACSGNKRCDTKGFIEKARKVHGDTYDYSLVDYKNNKTHVKIICKLHGVFEQAPDKHLAGRGCPGCATSRTEATNMSRYGVKRPLQNKQSKAKAKRTNIARYGVDNPMKSEEVQAKLVETNMQRYGVPYSCMNDDVSDKRHATNLERYGGITPFASFAVQQKSHETIMDRFGTDNVAKLDSIQTQIRDTNIAKYGVNHPMQTDEVKELVRESKRENNTFHTSSSEDALYKNLCDIFGESDVVRQYTSDVYPFACDFYIKSRDMYIELNASWMHGHHWFNTLTDMEIIEEWSNKHTDYYDNAILVWSDRDVLKRKTARDNRLNYVVFWTNKLLDFEVWKSIGCPDGKDYEKMYSWLPDRNDLKLNDSKISKFTTNRITKVTKFYQQKAIFSRELDLWKMNPYYRETTLQMYLYHNRLKYLGKTVYQLSDFEILRGLSIAGIVKGYTKFDTTAMDDVLKSYDIGSVIDPCAGWGERLLCCYANGVSYNGFDINELLKDGYDNMISDFNMTSQTFTVYDSSVIGKISGDAVITCPPYHNVEVYSDRGAENLSYDEFLLWWDKVVTNFGDVTYFCIQINQKYKDDMLSIILEHDFEFVEEKVLSSKASHFNRLPGSVNKKEYESMLICKKIRPQS